MTCKDAELAIIKGDETRREAVSAHCESCADCRAFAAFQQKLMENPPNAAPSVDLDRQVLDQAREHLSRGETPHLLRWRHLSMAAAAVAAIALLLSAMVWLNPADEPVVTQNPAGDAEVRISRWTTAVLDLETINAEVDAALAQLNPDAKSTGLAEGPGSEADWDALLELEFDVYFESERLQIDG